MNSYPRHMQALAIGTISNMFPGVLFLRKPLSSRITSLQEQLIFAGRAWEKKLVWTLYRMQSQVRFAAYNKFDMVLRQARSSGRASLRNSIDCAAQGDMCMLFESLVGAEMHSQSCSSSTGISSTSDSCNIA